MTSTDPQKSTTQEAADPRTDAQNAAGQEAEAERRTIAFVVYPGFTPLDLVGPLQVLGVLEMVNPSFRVVTVAESTDLVSTDVPIRIAASHSFAEVPNPYAVLVPGGMGPTFRAMTNPALLGYLRDVAPTAEYVTSVCTGSLILGAAGLLTGRRATTHWAALEMLSAFDATPVSERWVEDGPIITAAGVSAGIDLAIQLVSRFTEEPIARFAQALVEYDPVPPFGPIDWESVPKSLFTQQVRSTAETALAEHPELAAKLAATLS